MKKLDLWVGRRLLFSKKEIGFISWSGFVSILGVAIGSFALLLSLAVLNGFEKEIQQKVIGFETDLRLTAPSLDETSGQQLVNLLKDTEGVDSFSFFLERKGIAVSGQGRTLVWVKAVQDSHLTGVYRIGASQKFEEETSLPVAHLGQGVADRLGVKAGDSIHLLSPLDSQLYMGFPPALKVVVGSIYQTNILDFDNTHCFIPLADGQRLFRKQGYFHGVDVRLQPRRTVGTVKSDLSSRLPGDVRLSTWEDLHRSLFSAMRMERLGSIVVLSLIILVAAFNIASTLIMLVMEKVREIGILRAIGASRERIQTIFGFQGILIGGIGLTIGLALGLIVVLAQQRWGFVVLPRKVYFLESLPVLLSWRDVVIILGVAAVLIGVFVRYPARVAGKLTPREAIRFEK